MNAGKLLTVIRESKGLTQIQLAEMCGITQASISQIENGKRKAGKELSEKLSVALGCSMPKDILKDLLYKKIKRLSPKSAMHVIAIVDSILEGEDRNKPIEQSKPRAA